MKTLKIMLAALFLAATPAQAYGPADDIAPPDMNIAFFPPAKTPFTMHAIPDCLTRHLFTQLVMNVEWHLEEVVGHDFAIYKHGNGNVMWVMRSDGAYCITATGDPNYSTAESF